jgi:WD40 repeat protein
VEGAAFSPDGTRVVTASLDKTAQIWDVRLDEGDARTMVCHRRAKPICPQRHRSLAAGTTAGVDVRQLTEEDFRVGDRDEIAAGGELEHD